MPPDGFVMVAIGGEPHAAGCGALGDALHDEKWPLERAIIVFLQKIWLGHGHIGAVESAIGVELDIVGCWHDVRDGIAPQDQGFCNGLAVLEAGEGEAKRMASAAAMEPFEVFDGVVLDFGHLADEIGFEFPREFREHIGCHERKSPKPQGLCGPMKICSNTPTPALSALPHPVMAT